MQLENPDETGRWVAATPVDRLMLQRQAVDEARSYGADAVQVVSHDGLQVLYAAVFPELGSEDDEHLEGVLVPVGAPDRGEHD